MRLRIILLKCLSLLCHFLSALTTQWFIGLLLVTLFFFLTTGFMVRWEYTYRKIALVVAPTHTVPIGE